MDAENMPDWEKLKEIFHTAVTLPPKDRPAYLDRACAGDTLLRQSVESLLKSHENSGFVDKPAYAAAANLLIDDERRAQLERGAFQPEENIGRYRINSLLGEGGMGRVYLAEDTKLRRKVSLKFLSKAVTRDHERLLRFEQEARAASALNHPNILTIFEFGEEEEHQFIATEYIEGQTLRERLQRSVELVDALEIAIQIASALIAAHRVNIVHRDIKPDNIIIRKDDGLVKVLDFGLAKIVAPRTPEAMSVNDEAPTRFKTGPGVMMGTVAYMSPEQARGDKIDERTDIWSLGIVLYEMIAGSTPFVAETSNEIISGILSKHPVPPLTRFSHDVPERLREIVEKTLAKNRDERYQDSKDLLIDLKRVKQSLELQASIDRGPNLHTATSRGQGAETITAKPTMPMTHPMSSAEYIVNQVKLHKGGALVTLGVLAVVAAVTLSLYFRRAPAAPVLTDKDTILLADFDNRTGDSVFDGTLKQGVAVQLGQSPFLSIFPESGTRQTLKQMNRPPDERVFGDVAREICQRQGLKAFVTGSIALVGSRYVLTLEAINGLSGEVLTREQDQADGKDQVLKSLSQASARLREKLGESLSSIQKFDQPLQLTTSSLEALKVFSLGREQMYKGAYREAIPFMKRAIELDFNFAQAHSALATLYSNSDQPGRAAESASQAFSLRHKVSEIEQLRIANTYHSYVTHDLNKSIETLKVWKQLYPRDFAAPTTLSAVYAWIGQPDKSANEAREAIQLMPNSAVPRFNLAFALTRLNRFDEAYDVLQGAIQQKFDNSDIRCFLYMIFFVREDTEGMQQQLDWTKGRPDEYVGFKLQAHAASFRGHWREAQHFSRRAVDLAVESDAREVGATYAAEAAAQGAALGDCVQARAAARQSIKLTAADSPQPGAALALGLCGEGGQAQHVMALPAKVYPQDTKLNGLWLPTIEAAIELKRGNADKAIELLESASRYEAEAYYWPQTLRGQAYLKLKRPTEAVGEFQKIIDNRGQEPLSVLYPLAHLGLARAMAMTGNTQKSRAAYEQFFKLWQNANGDLRLLIEARNEYDKLT